jgi:molybdenum-dependent DNA-binding transcriptional regulator ModE
LIDLVINEKKSTLQASKMAGINYSTAKLIIKKYLRKGKVTRFLKEIRPLEE